MPHPFDWPLLPSYLAALVVGYMLGSIPFGLLLTRLAGSGDIRAIGSGNIGATNVLRTGRKGLAAATLVLDMLKGTAAVVLIEWLWGRDQAIIAGFGSFLGHMFPVWLGFKGGKAVATYIGVLIGLAPWLPPLAMMAIWLAVAAITRYSSVAGLVACAATPPLLWATGRHAEAALFLVLTVLVFVKHAPNIGRLVRGSEGKINLKSRVG
jgi:glycerol-3-phosphate acyltransferase PlsY